LSFGEFSGVRKDEIDGEFGGQSGRGRWAGLHELDRGLWWVDVRGDLLPGFNKSGVAGGGIGDDLGGVEAAEGGGGGGSDGNWLTDKSLTVMHPYSRTGRCTTERPFGRPFGLGSCSSSLCKLEYLKHQNRWLGRTSCFYVTAYEHLVFVANL
ncbi:hypothetical protein M8C21_006418, partial [Ambrosia artemisiifolia]